MSEQGAGSTQFYIVRVDANGQYIYFSHKNWIFGLSLPEKTSLSTAMRTNDNEMTTEEQLRQCKEQLTAIERAFLASENQSQKYALEYKKLTEWQNLHQNNFNKLQNDYENLRVQKGGFGFKILMASGFVGCLSGLMFCFLFFRLTDNRVKDFERFRNQQLFAIEYAISEGRFDAAEKILHDQSDLPENARIGAEIDCMRKLVTAAKRRCR